MPKEFYIKRGEKVRGPISEPQLKKLKADGKLKSTDLISNRSDGGWKPVSGKPARAGEKGSATSEQSLPPRRVNRNVERKPQPQAAAGKNRRVLLAGSVAVVGLLVAALSWLFWPSTEPGPVAENNQSPVNAEPAEPVVASPEPTSTVTDLLPLIIPEDCMIKGEATVEDSKLVMDVSAGGSAMIEIPYAVPRNYRLKFNVERSTPDGSFVIHLPYGSSSVDMEIDKGDATSGFRMLDGKDSDNNETTVQKRVIGDSQPHSIAMHVEGNEITVFVNKQLLTKLEADPSRVQPNPRNHHPNPQALTIQTWKNGRFAFSDLTLESDEAGGRAILPVRLQSQESLKRAAQVFGDAVYDARAIADRIEGQFRAETNESGDQRILFTTQKNGAKWKQLTIEDLQTLARLDGPVHLNLAWTHRLPLEGITALGAMRRLEAVDFFGNSWLTDEMFLQLPPEQLRVIGVRSAKVTDAIAGHVAKMKNLENVDVHVTRVGDETMTVLSELPKLTRVAIGSPDITDVGLRRLCSNKSIEVLQIWPEGSKPSVKITNASLDAVTELPALRKLEIHRTSIDRAAADAFRKAHSEVTVDFKPMDKPTAIAVAPAKPAPAPPIAKEQPSAKEQPNEKAAENEVREIANAVKIIGTINKRPKYTRNVKQQIDEQIRKIRDALENVKSKDALIVVGKVSLEGVGDGDVPKHLAMQCEVLDDGYFVTALRERAKPMLLVAHGYEPTEFTAPVEFDNPTAVHLEPVRLKKLSANAARIIRGRMTTHPNTSSATAELLAQPDISTFLNSPFSGETAKEFSLNNPHLEPQRAPVFSGSIGLPGCAAVPYQVSITMDGFASAEASFDGLELKPFEVKLVQEGDAPAAKFNVRALTINDFPGKFLADRVIPQKNLATERNTATTVQGRTYCAMAGHVVVPAGSAWSNVPPLIAIGTSNYARSSSSKSFPGWFCSSGLYVSNTSKTSQQIRIRAFGFEPIDFAPENTKESLQLFEITLLETPQDSLCDLTLKAVDNHGKAIPSAEVELRFADINSGMGSYVGSNDPYSLKFTTGANGQVVIPGIASAWYSWNLRVDERRNRYGQVFVEKDAGNVITIVCHRPKIIHLAVVPQPDGTGVFKGKSSPMVLNEDQVFYFDRVGKNGEREKGYLRAYAYRDQLLFSVDSNDGAWIVDLGEKDLADVKNAHGLKPVKTATATRPMLKVGHVYVMGTADNKHLKFRVTKIVQP